MDLTKYLGKAIRAHRETLRLSQEELAFRVGIDRTYVSGVERGVRNPTIKLLQKISEGLGVDLDVLFSSSRQVGMKVESGNS